MAFIDLQKPPRTIDDLLWTTGTVLPSSRASAEASRAFGVCGSRYTTCWNISRPACPPPQEILDDFPYLTREDIQACLQYAAERERHMQVGRP